MEIIFSKVLATLNIMGILKAQKPLETKLLAASMILQAKSNKAGLKIFGPEDIRQLNKSALHLS